MVKTTVIGSVAFLLQIAPEPGTVFGKIAVSVLTSMLLAGIYWLARNTYNNSRELALLRQSLLGVEGQGGLFREFRDFRRETKDALDELRKGRK